MLLGHTANSMTANPWWSSRSVPGTTQSLTPAPTPRRYRDTPEAASSYEIRPALSPKNYRAPRTEREKTLTKLFSEILGAGRVGIDDSSFAREAGL
ncbi:hypothetical protein [Nocardia sp. NPDC051832]|uniref:hypothetical protein n=1 Tax=Nocardia sp. NPDC051832 TaxID=3155673 RepID=UPI0034325CD0